VPIQGIGVVPALDTS